MAAGGLVSIVVPVYGVAEYVSQCIDSLLTQTHRSVEIIAVDDGSVDGSGEICDGFARIDRRVRVIHKRNGGLVSARKAGVAAATGDALGFVDGDDWVGDSFVESLHDRMSSASADIVISGHIREFLGKKEVVSPRSDFGTYDRAGVIGALLPTAIYNGTFFQHGVSTYVWNKLFRRRTALKFVQAIDEGIVMGEDAALTYPYLAACNSAVVCESVDYFYRQRANSIVKTVPDIGREYQRLGSLFRYLKSQFAAAPNAQNLLWQLRFYFYSQVLVRSGGVISLPEHRECMMAFPKLLGNQRVVIYSSGSFGQHLVNALDRVGGIEVVGWIDDDDHESQRSGMAVSSPEAIASMQFDLVLVASIDSAFGDDVARRLISKGIDANRISVLRPDFDQLDGWLSRIGFDLESYAFNPTWRRDGRLGVQNTEVGNAQATY